MSKAIESKKLASKKYINENKLLYIWYLFFSFCFTLLAIYIPFYLSRSIDRILSSNFDGGFSKFLISIVVLATLEFLFYYITSNINIKLSNKIAFKIEFDILRHIKFAKYDKIKNYDDVYLTQRINNDSVCVGDFIIEKALNFFIDLSLVISILSIMVFLDIVVTVLFLLFILLFFIIYLCFKRVYYKKNKIMLESQGKFFSTLSSQIFNVLLIKINVWFSETDNQFLVATNDFLQKSLKFFRVEFSMSGLIKFLIRIVFGISIIRISSQIISDNLTIGSLAIILIYIQLLLSSLQRLNDFAKYREAYSVSKGRIEELINLEVEENGSIILENIEKIEIKNLSTTLNEKRIFSDKSIILKKGEICLIKGDNGSGKSTFINTILGIITSYSGEILYNEIDIKNIDVYKLRKHLIAFTEQEPYLISGTIRENLTLGTLLNSSLGVEALTNSLLNFTLNKQEGLDTYLNSKNVNLSGGEKQKIAICRSLIKKADILIFDEPTSALDTESIKDFISEIMKIRNNRIILIVSHGKEFDDISSNILYF